jgi:hypothetical protein
LSVCEWRPYVLGKRGKAADIVVDLIDLVIVVHVRAWDAVLIPAVTVAVTVAVAVAVTVVTVVMMVVVGRI